MSPVFEKIEFDKLIGYQAQLPDSIRVQIKESKDGGYWVKILNLEGCLTQAESAEELFIMVNDAVYTYFGIPEKYIPYLPRYFPSEKIRKKLIQAWRKAIPAEFLQKPILFSQGVGATP